MSWYVRELFLNRDDIRNNIRSYNQTKKGDLDYEEDIPVYQEYKFDEDIYLDLLSVEQKYNELFSRGFITSEEDRIFKLVLTNKSISQIEKEENISRPTIIKKFYDICDRIAFHLGGYFTNDGYIQYLSDKYKLNANEVVTLKNYINEDI